MINEKLIFLDEEFCESLLPICSGVRRIINIDLKNCDNIEAFTEVIRKSTGCPDKIHGLDDLLDKILDFYWICDANEVILVFNKAKVFLGKLKSDDLVNFNAFINALNENIVHDFSSNYTCMESCYYIFELV